MALILAILLVFSCPVPGGFYNRQATVVELDRTADVVAVEDSDGFVWEFYGADSYENGDAVVLLMWNSGSTETIFDDAVVDCFLLASLVSLPA